MREEILRGLRQRPRSLPAKLLYDEKGSRLFERICNTPEYYVGRAETEILEHSASSIAHALGPDLAVIEPGCGNGRKSGMLLKSLARPAVFVPMEICREALEAAVAAIRRLRLEVPVVPVFADFTQELNLPRLRALDTPGQRKLLFFPGSTIGNFVPDEAVSLLTRFAELVGPEGALLVGFDRVKDLGVLESAYNDREGITAAFNLNLLHRLRREFAVQVDPEGFFHRAFFNSRESRIEMHLESRHSQEILLDEHVFRIQEGETIRTENSYKYTDEVLSALVSRAGLQIAEQWTDHQGYFSLCLLRSIS